MGRSNAVVVLLVCVLLSTTIGVAHARHAVITITTDKNTYHPGDTVHVTVKVSNVTGSPNVTVEIVPAFGGSIFVPTVSGTVTVNGVGNIALKLPDNVAPGQYYVGPVVLEGAFTLDPVVAITVT